MSWFDTLLAFFKPKVEAPAPVLDVRPIDAPPTPVLVTPPFRLTAAILAEALQITTTRATVWAYPLDEAMNRYSIDTPEERAMFLAQIGHESGRLQFVREIWGPTPAQVKYEGRKDLGNTQSGDGKRFMGRGLIQITGRTNYLACGNGLGMDLITHPELLELPDNAALSAAWYWYSHGLNVYANDIEACTRKINGGLNGLDDREVLWESAKIAMGVTQ